MKSFLSSFLGLIILCAVIVGCVRSCSEHNDEPQPVSDSNIESFDFLNSDPVNLAVGESDRSYFTIERINRKNPLSENDIIFVSSDENVATFTLDKRLNPESKFFYYYINAVGVGTAKVHLESSDGATKSEEILVTVTENQEKDGI